MVGALGAVGGVLVWFGGEGAEVVGADGAVVGCWASVWGWLCVSDGCEGGGLLVVGCCWAGGLDVWLGCEGADGCEVGGAGSDRLATVKTRRREGGGRVQWCPASHFRERAWLRCSTTRATTTDIINTHSGLRSAGCSPAGWAGSRSVAA